MSEDFSGREPGNMSVWNTFTSKRNDIAEEEEASGDSDGEDRRRNRYRNPLKASFSSAFQSIIGKKLDEEAVDAAPILSRNLLRRQVRSWRESSRRRQRDLRRKSWDLWEDTCPQPWTRKGRESYRSLLQEEVRYSIYPGMSYIMYSCAAIQHCSWIPE